MGARDDDLGSRKVLFVKEVCEQYRPMVRSLASRVATSFCMVDAFEDIEQDGLEGLVQAANRYDSSHGSEFATFAYYRVRGAMLDGIKRMGRSGRKIDPKQMAFDESASFYLEQRARETRNYGGEKGNRILYEVLTDLTTIYLLTADPSESALTAGRQGDPEVVSEERELRGMIDAGMDALPERDKIIIYKHYFESKSFESIGEDFGMSRSWICRLHSRAISRLREYFNTDTGGKGG